MKNVLLLAIVIFAGVPALAGQKPTFNDIARWPDGEVRYMNQQAAIEYCKDQGAHLPSARELAQLAMSLGAKGIGDSCGSDGQNCYPIEVTNSDGIQDSFYYNYSGYQRPAGDLGSQWFWSSSVVSDSPERAPGLSADKGDLFSFYLTGLGAVRCVVGR